MPAALELANSGYYVHLVKKSRPARSLTLPDYPHVTGHQVIDQPLLNV